jgi:SAM-dependent methyltransferase
LLRIWKKYKRRLRRKIVRDHLELFMATHATTEHALDLGCGTARYSSYFPNSLALDISKRKGVDIVGDAHSLPFLGSSFSIVVSTEMLEHVRNPQRVIDEIQRVLKPGGKLVLTTRFLFPIHDAPGDFFRFTKYGLAHLFRAWQNVSIIPDTKPFEAIGVLFQRMAFQSDFHASKIVSGICFLAAQFLCRINGLIRRQYGDYSRSVVESEIITSGYYVVAQKI